MSKRTINSSESKKHKTISQEKESKQERHTKEDGEVIIGKKTDNKTDALDEGMEKTEDQSAETDVQDDIAIKLEKAETESRDWYDKYLRLSAEFDNYRKRTMKEKADMLRFANEELLKSMLPVIDDFERGIDHIDKASDMEALKTGIQLIYNKFCDFIRQNGIKEIEARDTAFDLDFHEAVTTIPAPDEVSKGKIIDVIEKGYILNDKVIRYAKVILGE